MTMAFNIIDHLEPYIADKDGQGGDDEVISSEVLLAINKEYQELVTLAQSDPKYSKNSR